MLYPFFKVSPLKRVLSYFIPVTVASSSGTQNPFLEFILYRNQWQLATEEALYSDGDRYQPFRIAFKNIPRERLANVSECLVLGTGLGSVVQILWGKYKCDANYSLVEHDEKILKWALEYLGSIGVKNIYPYCDNAFSFVKKDTEQYDLICTDIFNGREVPSIFTEKEFLLSTRKLLKPGGIWIMNYIINDPGELMEYMRNVKEVFPHVAIVEKEQNRILIAM
jgi:hypothetical protein